MKLERPDWWDRAACRGMGPAFSEASHEDQVAVCEGTTTPWSRPCPVKRTCIEDLFRRTDEHGWAELIDGDLVCGGRTPSQQRVILSKRRRERRAAREQGDSA